MTAKLPDLALTPPDDPPELDLGDCLPCPICGCRPEWEHGGMPATFKLWCHRLSTGRFKELDGAIEAWNEGVMEEGDMEGENRKAEGQAKVTENNEAWMEMAINSIRLVASGQLPFTVEELRAFLPAPSHPNAWGAAFSAAAKQGLIVRTGYAKNKLASAHGRVVATWRGAK